ncbi:hypothetical protein CHS0354_042411 [Potamilus streckersoni]|uniref:Ig-like domain-containing protein n=1 Tax=Potamilus streckersoni TaxID=2493646 RepID=A0AAE0STP4_9BIVA|nr:hypothetical protein CHS0354_042411 [Potamilus streckersoni]
MRVGVNGWMDVGLLYSKKPNPDDESLQSLMFVFYTYLDIDELKSPTIPTFELQSLIYTPSTNLAENQNVIFTCIGNVGREPQGNFSWYKYVGSQPSGMVITNGINPVSLTTVSGSCTYMRTEKLTLNLTKEDNQMVIRCTVQQTTISEAGDRYIQTDRITVNYSPKINSILADPNLPTYSEGPVQLMLICKADSNPLSNYVWTRPDGSKQTGYQLRLRLLTTNHTGRYTCLAYAEWGGQNYTAKTNVDIEVGKAKERKEMTLICII